MSYVIKSNCHTHTVFCDGKNTADEMTEAAIKLGFTSLGFSGHSPMNFNNDWSIREDRLNDYISTINTLKNKYADKIEIYNGIELDADHTDIDISKFDYVIGSVHNLHCGDKIYSIDDTAEELCQCVEQEFDGSWLAMAKQYYSSVAKFICDEKPDIVGHYDLIEKFNENKVLFNDENAEYEMIACLYLERICRECPDIIFEVNTGAMYRCNNTMPYPAPFIMRQLKKFNMRITVTSDAHCTQSLDFAFDKIQQYCKSFGFNEVYILKNGKFEPISI
ncbi:MAG: histidinol-phosphatase [Faecalibacterium sp.]|nr:histidinol-phosphatase [Ruminococcus sp.]MCM1392350.1 histidinol-phosphatase [Ruminococcus sp.]MCM1484654.1 histidinol-phosphatase [Faecalibacterium sp.]